MIGKAENGEQDVLHALRRCAKHPCTHAVLGVTWRAAMAGAQRYNQNQALRHSRRVAYAFDTGDQHARARMKQALHGIVKRPYTHAAVSRLDSMAARAHICLTESCELCSVCNALKLKICIRLQAPWQMFFA